MIRTFSNRALLVGALSAGALGCFRAPVDPPVIALERGQQRSVLACQAEVDRQSAKLSATAARHLRRCAREALDLRLEEERELNSSNIGEYVERREEVLEGCAEDYARIGRASTKMIDSVIRRCQAVESEVLTDPLRGDPLGWKGEIDFGEIELPGPENVADLAGTVCGIAIGNAEMAVSLAMPRVGDLVKRYYNISDEFDFQEVWQAALDPRCSSGMTSL